MAQEFRHAGIGIDLNIQGMDKLTQLNRMLDKTVDRFRGLGSIADNANNRVEKFGSDGSKAIDKMSNSSTQARRMMNDLTNAVRDTTNSLNSINDGHLQAVNRTVQDTNRHITETVRNVGNLQRDVNGFKSEEITKLSTNMTKAGKATKTTGEETERATGHLKSFKDTAMGTFAGNIISNAMQNMGTNFKDIFTTGLKVNATLDDINTRWKQAGLNAQQRNGMVDQIQEIRNHADISAAAITNMQKQFLSMTGSADQAMALTSSVTSFSKAGNLKPQQVQGLTRLMSSNKAVNARMFNRTLGTSPNFVNEIIKQTGMSKDAFYSLLQAGKFTGQELRNAMIKASKDSNMAWSDYAKTTTGKMDLMKVTFNNTKNTFASAVAGSAFNFINKMAGNSKQLNDIQKTLKETAQDAGKAIGGLIGSGVAFITKNLKPLESMAKSLWSIVKALVSGAWSTITAPLKLISTSGKNAKNSMQSLADKLQAVSKHKTALKVIGSTLVGMFVTLKAMQGVIFFNKFVESMGSLVSTTKDAYKAIKDFSLAEKIAEVQGKALALVNKAVAVAQWAVNVAMDANPIGIIIVAIVALIGALYELYKHFKPFRNLVNGTFKAIGKAIGAWWKQCEKNFAAVKKVIGVFAAFFKKYFANVIQQGVKNAKQAFKVIGDIIRVFKDVFTLNFKDLGKVIPKLVGDLWKLVKGLFTEGADFVEDIGSNMWKSIWKTFSGWGKSIGNFFVDLWKGIKQSVADGINDVTGIINDGIKGLNWILSKVGGSGHTIGYIPKVKFAQGTMGGRLTKHTMAMLNDGHDSPQTGNKEMAILPNGRAFIPQQRNWTGILPKGTMVLNATQTRELMAMHGIEKFGLGTVAGNLWNGAKSVAGKAWNGAKHVVSGIAGGAKAVANAIAHPIKFLKSFFGSMPKLPEFLTDFTGGIANKAKNAIINYFKQFGGSADNPTGTSLNRWKSVIQQAGAFMHDSLSASDINLILKRIQRESGGNPTITQQVSDVNSAAGHPAQGLLQYVPSTFASWAVAGHKNLLSGFDQLLAMFNDSNWRTDIANNGGWGPTGHRARKNGGPVLKNQWYKVNEAGQELFKPNVDGQVINHNESKAKLSGIGRKANITIDARIMNMKVDGNSSKEEIYTTFQQAHEDALRGVAEKLSSTFGIDDPTGYYPI